MISPIAISDLTRSRVTRVGSSLRFFSLASLAFWSSGSRSLGLIIHIHRSVEGDFGTVRRPHGSARAVTHLGHLNCFAAGNGHHVYRRSLPRSEMNASLEPSGDHLSGVCLRPGGELPGRSSICGYKVQMWDRYSLAFHTKGSSMNAIFLPSGEICGSGDEDKFVKVFGHESSLSAINRASFCEGRRFSQVSSSLVFSTPSRHEGNESLGVERKYKYTHVL